MPYVHPESRPWVACDPPVSPGDLTYILQQVIQEYLLGRLRDDRDRTRYADVAEVLGAIEGLKADIIRRVLTPLEGSAQERNGDVWDPCLVRS